MAGTTCTDHPDREKQQESNTEDTFLERQISFLTDMTVYENQVLLDDEYMSNGYYDMEMQLRNNGFLTLISKVFMPVIAGLMGTVNTEILSQPNFVGSLTGGKEYVRIVKEKVKTHGNLAAFFLKRSEKFTQLDDAGKTTVWRELCEKVCNCSIGEALKNTMNTMKARPAGKATIATMLPNRAHLKSICTSSVVPVPGKEKAVRKRISKHSAEESLFTLYLLLCS